MAKKVTCEYCFIFRGSSKRRVEEEQHGKKSILTKQRYCRVLKDYISSKHKICDKFELTKYFWCTKDHNWIPPKVCVARRTNKKEGCVRCSQGGLIQKLYEERSNG